MRNYTRLAVLCLCLFSLSSVLSCRSRSGTLTGVFDSPKMPKHIDSKGPLELVYIPSGTYLDGDTAKGPAKTVSVSSYYLSTSEISNKEYRRFLQHLKESGDTMSYQIALYDSTQWKQYCMGATALKRYHSQEQYDAYPVVNISYSAALLYCEWLAEEYREKFMNKMEGYDIVVSLPTTYEWTYAAVGGYSDYQAYSWGDAEGFDEEGRRVANFDTSYQAGPGHFRQPPLYCPENEPQPVSTKQRNEFGLCHMSGNVAEFTLPRLPDNHAELFPVETMNGLYHYEFAKRFPEKMIHAVMGGSWKDPLASLNAHQLPLSQGPNPFTGFRVVLHLIPLVQQENL